MTSICANCKHFEKNERSQLWGGVTWGVCAAPLPPWAKQDRYQPVQVYSTQYQAAECDAYEPSGW